MQLPSPVRLIAACVVTAAAAVAGAGATREPVPEPAAVRRPAAPYVAPDDWQPTLDMRLEEDPEAVIYEGGLSCATTFGHAEYDRSLRTARPAALRKGELPQAILPLPSTYIQNGIVVIEDNGTVLRDDNVFDLLGRTIRFVPQGAGYRVQEEPLTYDADIGAVVHDDVRSFASHEHTMALSFPFGGTSRDRVWITTNLGVYFADPSAPGPDQWHTADLLFDRTPRVSPMLMARSLRGYTAYVRERSDRLIVTWQQSNMDVQLILHDDGEIVMTYQEFAWEYGAPVVITGNDAWWGDRRDLVIATDPVDVTLGKPEDTGLDVVRATARQIATSDVFEFELELAGDVPNTASLLYYDVTLWVNGSDPGGAQTIYVYVQNGATTWTNSPGASLSGDRLTVLGRLEPDTFRPTDFHARVNTWINDGAWSYADGADLGVVIPGAPPEPVMRDLSRDLPLTIDGPIFEAFTIPELRPYEVERVLAAEYGAQALDGVSVFQNLNTDIIFYAGGYSTVGNAGADGIGVGNSTDPVVPALLHMNRIRRGWNTSRAGRTLLINQEFGHHWIYFARIDVGGSPSDIVNPDGAHYAGWVHVPAVQPIFFADDSSSLGGSWWVDHGDGTFDSSPALSNYGFSWADMYLLGLADPSEVDASDWWYIADPVPRPARAYWPSPGFHVDSGTKTDVTIQQIIDNHGPRVPAYPNTQRDFQVPYVLVVRPDAVPAADVDELRLYCDEWVQDWDTSTLSRSTVNCAGDRNQAPDGAIVLPPSTVTVGEGQTVDFAGDAVDPDGDPVSWVWTFDGGAPDSTQKNPGSITFVSAGVYDVCLTVTDLPGLADPAPPCVEVVVTCAMPPASAGNTLLMVRADPTTLHAYWSDVPTAIEYGILWSLDPAGPFVREAAIGTDGSGGVAFAMPLGPPLVSYRVEGRVGPGCVGSID